MPLTFVTLKSLILLSSVNLKRMHPNAFKGSLALWMFKTHSRHVKAHAPLGGQRIFLIPALPVCQYVLTLVFILLEDWISHLHTSWKFLQQPVAPGSTNISLILTSTSRQWLLSRAFRHISHSLWDSLVPTSEGGDWSQEVCQ